MIGVDWLSGALASGLAHTEQPELLRALIKHQLAAMPPHEHHIDTPRFTVIPITLPRLLLWCQQLLLSSTLMAIRAVATLAGQPLHPAVLCAERHIRAPLQAGREV